MGLVGSGLAGDLGQMRLARARARFVWIGRNRSRPNGAEIGPHSSVGFPAGRTDLSIGLWHWSHGKMLVGVRGFEPPAPASRKQCSTRLSYTPPTAPPIAKSASPGNIGALGQQFTERQVQISTEPPLTPGLPENRACGSSSKRCLARSLPQPGRTVEFLGRRCFRRPLADGQVAPYVLGPCIILIIVLLRKCYVI